MINLYFCYQTKTSCYNFLDLIPLKEMCVHFFMQYCLIRLLTQAIYKVMDNHIDAALVNLLSMKKEKETVKAKQCMRCFAIH